MYALTYISLGVEIVIEVRVYNHVGDNNDWDA